MILCVGEILADMIGAENNGSFYYERKAGGAPFNVACAAKKVGAKTAFVGCVGDDLIGEFLTGFAKGQGLDKLYIKKDCERNTTLAFVNLDSTGERSFCFYRKNTADYHLPEVPKDIFDSADLVYIGSLMLSEECGKEYALKLAQKAREAGKTVAFDVNFRTDIFRDRQAALDVYKAMLAVSDVVKFSEDEVEIFTQEYIDKELEGKLICISLGGKGSRWIYGGQSSTVASIKVKPIDTTGAGDAFFGGVLRGLDGVDKINWTPEFLDKTFKYANVCGALNTLGRGAIDGLPDDATVQEKLKLI